MVEEPVGSTEIKMNIVPWCLCFVLFLLLYTFLIMNYGIHKGSEIAAEQIYISHYHASEDIENIGFTPPERVSIPKGKKK